MKKAFFKSLAKINKSIFPSYGRKQIDMSQASKLQMAIIGYRWYVTKNAL